MTSKKWIIALLLAVVLMVSGGIIVGISATPGDATDPLVTLDYLEKVFKPTVDAAISEAVDAAAKDYNGSLDQTVEKYLAQIDQKLEAVGFTGDLTQNAAFVDLVKQAIAEKVADLTVKPSSENETFKLLELTEGQLITASVGCEILLRSGSNVTALCFGESALVDITAGSGEVTNGGTLEFNRIYLVTADGDGIVIGAGGAKIMIRGSYTVGSVTQ